MKIQNGKLYENKTWKFLFPCLRAYGEDVINKFNAFFKIAVGIGDFNITTQQNCLYILIDTNISLTERGLKQYKENFNLFLDWFRLQHFYVKDYLFDDSNTQGKHMLVIRVPSDYYKSYSYFLEGKYSKMYTKEQLDVLFKIHSLPKGAVEHSQNERAKKSRDILERKKEVVKSFVNRVNLRFKTTATYEDFKDAEVEFPIDYKEEIFNYK